METVEFLQTHNNGLYSTHEIAQNFIKAGFSEQQAEVFVKEHVKLVNSNLATKQNIENLSNETRQNILLVQQNIEKLRSETKQDIELVKKDIELVKKDIEKSRSDTKQDIEKLRSETKQDIALVKKDIETLRSETKQDIALVKQDIELVRRDLTITMGKMTVVTISVLVGFITFIEFFVK